MEWEISRILLKHVRDHLPVLFQNEWLYLKLNACKRTAKLKRPFLTAMVSRKYLSKSIEYYTNFKFW